MTSKFLFSFSNFSVIILLFLTKLLILGLLFSIAVTSEVVAKPLKFGILFSMSVILAL